MLVLLAFVRLSLPAQAASRGPDGSQAQFVTTNHVLVTNLVITAVTNYLVTTNVVIQTNAPPAQAGKSKKSKKLKASAMLPDLNWVPPADPFDWIQLKSGEWLRGRLKALQDRELEFDSEELDDLTFDWKDIRQVRSSHTLDVLFVSGEKVSGPVAITPTEVAVSGAVPRALPRDQLQSLTPGGSRERNYWSGKLSLGATVRAGNTEQIDFNTTAGLERRTPATRLNADYIGNLSTIDGVENVNNHRVSAEFDLWLSRRLYLILPFAEYYKDPLQNLAHRVTGGLGVGYDLIDRPKLEWSISTGPALQYAWFESAQAGEPSEKGTAALIFGTSFDWDITRKIEWILEYHGQFTSREIGETTHHAMATLSLEVTRRMDLDVSLTWDRINQPKVGADGLEPEPDDFRLVLGLGIDF